MPRRITPFVNGQFYHIYNRGVEKRRIFNGTKDYQRFVNTLEYYGYQGPKPKFSRFLENKIFPFNSNNKIIEVVAYCLMPNHFHIIVKQVQENGIFEFMSKISNSYTKYFNLKYKRVGPLFQGEFKAIMLQTDEQLLHVTRYTHLNPTSSFLVRNLHDWEWSSYQEYVNNKSGLCAKDQIMQFFETPQKYQQFVLDQMDYAQNLEIIKHHMIDE